ncbi:CD2 antigen cytoplasmic tail-binding protein 2 homolog [Episyrphus balteatus]|uniref:CD2 antigen cytoplasmic tail-binding protein 2 homolog n=1 Tax=Episyrphus balteatus TaxID=286459 RepID=UPI002485335E|nr:CD2 antigen cytoplasmic tail-binding protein 2 homolog [Episyrphus balteatus]
MASKRKAQDDIEIISNKKHTLDSDEEDDKDDEDVMNESDIEGEEDGIAGVEDEVKITPFNMKEELEEGYFDKSGHYHWKRENQIQDNWLDNIDWLKIKSKKEASTSAEDDKSKLEVFNSREAYAKILEMMEPNETITKTLQRFGKNKAKLSTLERLRRKKEGIVDEASESITKLSELAHEILVNTGNMGIYEEPYEKIKSRCGTGASTSKAASDPLDMYADDFDDKEKNRVKEEQTAVPDVEETTWEYKWKESDTEVHGPFSTQQMQAWVDEKYFKKPILVRKYGTGEGFYSSSRIDFELYL